MNFSEIVLFVVPTKVLRISIKSVKKHLKSKKILTINEREEEIARKWLFVKMKKEGIKNPSEIINPFVKVPKASKRILSVFLKKADAIICIGEFQTETAKRILNFKTSLRCSEKLKIFSKFFLFVILKYNWQVIGL